MRRFFICLIFILCISCKHTPQVDRNMICIEDTLCKAGLDSLFLTDSLSFNMEDWIPSTAVEENKDNIFYKYVYIKEITDSTQIIYTLSSYQDTLYIINKRTVK